MPDAPSSPAEPPPPADLDLRLVRCFTVLAEHRHFGRAAAATHLTPSSLSRQITHLEQQVGARLLDRTPQGTRLTEAGEVFLPLATAALRTTSRAAARARSAVRPSRITVGYIGNLIITPAVRELRHRHPDADVRTRHLDWNDVRAALLDHRVDAAVARLPTDHRLAGKESVTVDDIAGEPLPRPHDQAWDAFWRIDPRPDGSRAPDGPDAHTVEDKIELIAGGQAVAIVPAGASVGGLRPDLTAIPLTGVEPCHVVLATRAGDRGRLVAAFRKYADIHLTGSARPTL